MSITPSRSLRARAVLASAVAVLGMLGAANVLALDSLKIVSEQLPAELTLKSFVFSGGRKLSLAGEAPMDQQSKVTEFNAQLNSTMLHGAPFFVKVNPPTINARSGNSATWNFDCELRTTDTR